MSRCFTTFGSKTIFLTIICYGSWTDTSDFAFVRENLKASYSHTGRTSIDPEVLLRILLIGYLYGITSKRRLVEDVGMHIAGLPAWASIKRFRITRHSPKIGTAVFRNRQSSLNSSNASSSSV